MRDAREQLQYGVRCERSGRLRQALEAYENVVGSADHPALLAEALRRKSDVYRHQCAWDNALAAARASAETAISSGLSEQFTEALNAEAAVYLSRGDLAAAASLLEKILTLTTADRILGIAHQNLGQIAAQVNEFDAARSHFQASREHFGRAGYRRGEAIAWNNQAAVANLTGDHEAAHEAAKEALAMAREVGDFDLIALASLNRAQVLIAFKRYAEAEDLASQALGFYGLESNAYRQIECLRLLGDIARDESRIAGAIRCYEHGLKMAERIDAQLEAAQLERRIAELEGITTA